MGSKKRREENWGTILLACEFQESLGKKGEKKTKQTGAG